MHNIDESIIRVQKSKFSRIIQSSILGGSNWFVRLTLLADKDYTLHDLLSYMANTKITDDPCNQLMDFAHLLRHYPECH
jgi:hypothetical protein